MNYWIVLFFLIYETVEDLRTRSIPLVSLIVFGVLGILGEIFFWKTGVWSICSGVAAGMILMVVSGISRGAFGIGDAAVFLVTGIFLGAGNLRLLCAAFAAAMVCGIFIIFFRKQQKEIPFVPCVLFAYLEVMLFAA